MLKELKEQRNLPSLIDSCKLVVKGVGKATKKSKEKVSRLFFFCGVWKKVFLHVGTNAGLTELEVLRRQIATKNFLVAGFYVVSTRFYYYAHIRHRNG